MGTAGRGRHSVLAVTGRRARPRGARLAGGGAPQAGEALRLLRQAADQEDAVEKLPVTPGPIVPAREQLGDLLLTLHRPSKALAAYRAALTQAPRRRGSLTGAIESADAVGDSATAMQLRGLLAGPGEAHSPH